MATKKASVRSPRPKTLMKIEITGAVGVGKTTLARALSHYLNELGFVVMTREAPKDGEKLSDMTPEELLKSIVTAHYLPIIEIATKRRRSRKRSNKKGRRRVLKA